MGALIVFGAMIAVWQISVMRARAQRLYDIEQPALAVLMAHNHFQRFQAELQLLAETRDAPRFTAKANELRKVFNDDVDPPFKRSTRYSRDLSVSVSSRALRQSGPCSLLR